MWKLYRMNMVMDVTIIIKIDIKFELRKFSKENCLFVALAYPVTNAVVVFCNKNENEESFPIIESERKLALLKICPKSLINGLNFF